MKTKATKMAPHMQVWSVEVLTRFDYMQWFLRLSPEVARYIESSLSKLVARKKIRGYQIELLENRVVPAFHFYARYGLDK